LKHGLCAMQHLVLEGEVPDDLEALIAHLTDEIGTASEIEVRLARRLAIAFWKGERAERIEVALFDAAPRIRPPTHGPQWEQADPLTTFDVRRFNAVRGQQAQIGREIRHCLAELRALRKDALARTDEPEDRAPEQRNYTNDLWHGTYEPGGVARNEPETSAENEPNITPGNEPGSPAVVNDDAALPADPVPRNEPGSPRPANDDAASPAELRYAPNEPVPARIAVLRAAIMAEHAARLAEPARDPAIMDGLVEEFGAAWAEVDAGVG
jgi:hypothetical protein